MEIIDNVESYYYTIECSKCTTVFKMDEDEFLSIDANLNCNKYKESEDGRVECDSYWFECPVCRAMRRAYSVKKKLVMSNGHERTRTIFW